MSEKFCQYCISCRNDCMSKIPIDECQNYVEAIPLEEIKDMISEQNVNLRRFCKENGLKYYILMDYLKGKKIMKYKYYKLLLDRLLEKEEFLPYLDDMEVED